MVKFFVYMSCFFLLVKSGTIEITVEKDTESNNGNGSSDGNSPISVKITEITSSFTRSGWLKQTQCHESLKPPSLILQIKNEDSTDDTLKNKICPTFTDTGESKKLTFSNNEQIEGHFDGQDIEISCEYNQCDKICLKEVNQNKEIEIICKNNKKEMI